MAERSNLALDIQRKSTSNGDASGSPLIARVYLDFACSYLRDGGAPTITADCTTFSEFEREVSRIRHECEELLENARREFGGSGSDAPGSTGREPRSGEADQPGTGASRQPAVKIEKHLMVSDVMTRDVKSVRRNDKLSVADDLMKVGKFRHVVVLDDGSDELVGVISHRDIFYGALEWSTGLGEVAHQKSLESIPAKDVMNSHVITTTPGTPLADACRVMIDNKIGCLPVVEDRVVRGILTEGDLLAILSSAQYGDD